MKSSVLSKNKSYEMEVTDLGTKGEGIGKVQNFTVFVRGGLPGDLVQLKIFFLKPNFGVAKLEKIIRPSSQRVAPICPIFEKCGGCQIMQMDYASQLALKFKKVQDSLLRIAKTQNPVILPIIQMEKPVNYRNKAQFALGFYKEEIKIGLFSINTHHVVNAEKCYIQDQKVNEVLAQFRKFCNETKPSIYHEKSHQGLIRNLVIRTAFFTGEVMAVVVLNGGQLPEQEKLLAYLQKIPGFRTLALNINTQKGDVIFGAKTEVVWGTSFITEKINDISFQLSATSFFQVNPIQAKKLIETVLAFAGESPLNLVYDLYCGIGTFALFLAQKAQKVIGIEVFEEAIQDARKNAELNNLKNLEFICAKAEEIMPTLVKEKKQPDLVVIDPPRKGCDQALLDALIKTQVPKIIYISCNPDTFSRDLAYLEQNGFKLAKVQPVDMFPHTVHIELVGLIIRA